MIFDSHAHLIADDDGRYPPSPLLGRLREGDLDTRFTAEHLLGLMDKTGVERICAVQRAHVYGYDNRYVVDSAKRYPDRMVAVAAVNADSPTAGEDVRRWADQGAVGVRFASLTPQVADTDWFASPRAVEAWEAAHGAGLSICLHVFQPLRLKMLADLAPLLDCFDQTTVVIDHVSSAALDLGPPDHGVDEALMGLKTKPNAFLKLTTINLRRTIEAGKPTPPMVKHLVDQLGADKVMWGSDIAQTKGDYVEMVDLLHEAASLLSAADRQMLFGGTAAAVYGSSPTPGRAV